MGRPPWSSRLTTEQCLSLSTVALHRAGVFRAYPGSRWTWKWSALEVALTITEVPGRAMGLRLEHITGASFRTVVVPVTTTRPHLGGRRFWFLCPMIRGGVRCGRGSGRLYLPPGAEFWGCRPCYNLTYVSVKTHDARKDRLLKNPDLLTAALRSDNPRQRLLGIGAWAQAVTRLSRHQC